MDPLPTLTEPDVARRVGAASFDRGKRYFRKGAIREGRREGRTLRAACEGSSPEPYDVRVTFDGRGIAEAECSCPVGDVGRCKHVAALLLTWIGDPDRFIETEPVESLLQRRSKDELVALVRQMVARHPDLEDLVATPAPGSGRLDPAVIARQVRRAFSGDLYEWGSAYRVGRDLERIARQGDAYVQADDWASAITLCQAVLDGIREHYAMLHDENGDLALVVNSCVAHLGRALEHATDPDVRAEVVRLLHEVLVWNVDAGGIDLGYEAEGLILEHATREERDAVCRRIEEAVDRLGTAAGWDTGWRRAALGGLWLALLPDDPDDETFLRICRASGRTEDLVTRLLDLGRPDEAVDAARSASDYVLLNLAPAFIEHGHDDAIDALMLGRLGEKPDRRVVAWLKDRARDRGDAPTAQRLAEQMFQAAPSVERYAEVLELSRELGREAEVREALREHLRTRTLYAVLTKALLHDGDLDEALAVLRIPKKEWLPYGGWFQARLTVAAAVASTRPEEAIQLHLDAATDLVEKRNRESYAEAARQLLAVRALYRQRGKADDWALLLAKLRAAYKGLPALQDEWTRAGLEGGAKRKT